MTENNIVIISDEVQAICACTDYMGVGLSKKNFVMK